MAVEKGRVVEQKLYLEIEGKRIPVPEACSQIKGEHLAAFSCTEVEVLMAKDRVLAIRALDPKLVFPWPPIITCYLMPPDIPFNPDIMREIEPIITRSLVESGVLSEDIADQLGEWQEEYG